MRICDGHFPMEGSRGECLTLAIRQEEIVPFLLFCSLNFLNMLDFYSLSISRYHGLVILSKHRSLEMQTILRSIYIHATQHHQNTEHSLCFLPSILLITCDHDLGNQIKYL